MVCQALGNDDISDTGGSSLGHDSDVATTAYKINFVGSSGVSRSSLFEFQPSVDYLKYTNKNVMIFKGDILTVKISVLAKNRADNLSHLRVIEDIPNEVAYIDSNPNGIFNKTLRTLTWNLDLNYPNEGHFSYRISLNKSGNYVVSGATRVYTTIKNSESNKDILQSYQIDPIYTTVYNKAPIILDVEYNNDIWWIFGQEIRAKIYDPDNKELKCKLLLDGSKEIGEKSRPKMYLGENHTYYEFAWLMPDLGRGLFHFKLEATDNESSEITIGDPTKEFFVEEGFPINLWSVAEILLSAIFILFIDFFITGRILRANEIIDFIVHHMPFLHRISVEVNANQTAQTLQKATNMNQASSMTTLNVEVASNVYSEKDRQVLYCPKGNYMGLRSRIYLTGADLDKVKNVKYLLRPLLSNPVAVSEDMTNDFEVWIWTYSDFPIKARITTKTGQEFEKDFDFSFKSNLEESKCKGIPQVMRCEG